MKNKLLEQKSLHVIHIQHIFMFNRVYDVTYVEIQFNHSKLCKHIREKWTKTT